MVGRVCAVMPWLRHDDDVLCPSQCHDGDVFFVSQSHGVLPFWEYCDRSECGGLSYESDANLS